MRQTVLEAYQRLEAEAVWRAGADAQGQNAVVSIGQATLTIANQNDMAFGHWSLAALERVNPGKLPAVFSPGGDATETVEIAEPEMVAALERVMRALKRGGERRRWLRFLAWGGVAIAVATTLTLWLPGAMARYTAQIMPEAARNALGDRLAFHVATLTGAACDAPEGLRSLKILERRLYPQGGVHLMVIPSTLSGAATLPGGRVLLSHTLVEDFESPAIVAGYASTWNENALERLLTETGPLSIFRILTTGELTDADLRRYAERLVGAPLASLDIAAVAPRLAAAGLSVEELADALQGEAPPGTQPVPPAALSDGQWLALQSICGR